MRRIFPNSLILILCLSFAAALLYPCAAWAATCDEWIAKAVSVEGVVEGGLFQIDDDPGRIVEREQLVFGAFVEVENGACFFRVRPDAEAANLRGQRRQRQQQQNPCKDNTKRHRDHQPPMSML